MKKILIPIFLIIQVYVFPADLSITTINEQNNNVEKIQTYIIDRFEGEFAVCEETENGVIKQTVDLQQNIFENQIKEGDVFKLLDGKPVFLLKEQENLEKEIDFLFDELKG